MRSGAAAAVAAVLLVLAACGGGGDGAAELVRDADPVTTSSSALATTTTTVGSSSTTSTTVRRGTTTTTTARRAGATTTSVAPGAAALTPAPPGTYRYDTSGSTTFAGNTLPFPGVTSLVIDPPLGTTQRQTRNLRDARGNGLATEFVLDYRPQGVFLVSLRLTVGLSGVTDVRELRPPAPVPLLPTGARRGAHLESDLAGPPGTAPAKLVVDVVGEERVTVGGQGVDALVLRAGVTLPPGDITGRQQLTVHLDRGTRLWVRERAVTDASAAGGLFTLHSDYTATLQRLTP